MPVTIGMNRESVQVSLVIGEVRRFKLTGVEVLLTLISTSLHISILVSILSVHTTKREIQTENPTPKYPPSLRRTYRPSRMVSEKIII